jgi:hypothetical protein
VAIDHVVDQLAEIPKRLTPLSASFSVLILDAFWSHSGKSNKLVCLQNSPTSTVVVLEEYYDIIRSPP